MSHRQPNRLRGRCSGFSLIEVLAALAVVGVAATVFMSFFVSSVDLAGSARNRGIAATLAEEQLSALTRQPEQFQWCVPSSPTQEHFDIRLADDDPKAGNPCELPAVLPAEERANLREEALFSGFRWKAEGRLPTPNAAWYEVTAVIHWTEGSRPQMLALTTALPVSRVHPYRPPAPAPQPEEEPS